METIETQAPSAAPARIDEPAVARRWSAWMALLTAWWLPATTARRTQHVRLLDAFLVHVLAAVVAPVLAAALACWYEDRTFTVLAGEIINEIEREYRRNPAEVLAIAGMTIGLVEGGFLALALLLSPWGAADEPIRSSFKNAVRQTWLHTSGAIPWLVGISMLFTWLIANHRRSYEELDRMIEAQRLTWAAEYHAPGTLTPEEEKRQEEGRKQIDQLSQQWNASRPWYDRHPDDAASPASFVACVCFLWALMRAIGVRRQVVPISRPPTCEDCGYNLSGTPVEGRCPECGEPAVESLGPQARAGASWEQRRQIGRLRAWWQTSVCAARRAKRFGRQLRLSHRVVDHRLFLVGHLVAFFAAGYAMTIGSYYAMGVPKYAWWTDRPATVADIIRQDRVLFDEAPITGAALLTGALALPLLAALLVGLWAGRAPRRNLLPVSMQAAAYLSGFLLMCTIVSGLLGMLIMVMVREWWLMFAKNLLHIDDEVIGAICWGLASFALLAWYFILLYRATAAARYANR